MKASLLDMIVCPSCKKRLGLEAGKRGPSAGEILEGTLSCAGCREKFRIQDGIPILMVSADYQGFISRSFGFQWRLRRINLFETGTLYGRDAERIRIDFLERLSLRPEEIRGKRILDAGCGSGLLVHALSSMGCEVVGIDVSHPIGAFELNQGQSNSHIVTADIYKLPFPDGMFDIVWSEGVLHHTPDPSKAFRSLQRVLKPGGTGYAWVYSKSPKERLRRLFRTPSLPGWLLFAFCYCLCVFRCALAAISKRAQPGGGGRVVSVQRF
jgi:SAM-dependent methyltransferase/uncharacterized protein YbaR (Trm112 family)